jgi:hypothetical protein
MNRLAPATLPAPSAYDHCLISACLRSLFKCDSKSNEPDFIVKTSVAQVKQDLEQLNKDVTELSYEYLAAMEQSMKNAGFRYIVVHEKGKPVLFAYFQLFTLTSRNFNLEKNKGFVRGIVRFFLDLKKVNVLISGNALRNDTACFCFDEKVLTPDGAVEIVASAAEKIAADEQGAALILKDIPVTGRTRKWLGDLGFYMPWEDQVMVMDIDPAWTGLTDYASALSRKYKTRASKILQAADRLTERVLTEMELIEREGQMNKLFKNVAANQSFVLTQPGATHFSDLKKIYKGDFEVVGIFDGHKLVAFYSAFVTDADYEVYYVGFDYDLNNEYQLYFNMLFSGLGRAITLKKDQLKLGRTSFDAKASIGAKPQQMDYLLKTSSIPTVVSRWFTNYFSTMEDAKWKLRNPLKSAVG